SIGLPGTSGFVGEFLVLLGAYRTQPIFAFVAASGIILAAIYFLWALQRMLFDEAPVQRDARTSDVNRRELGVMLLLTIAVITIGLAPGPILRRMEPSAQLMVERVLEAAGASAAVEAAGGTGS